ncbi:MAG: prepilin-type N-terminal cleavage/methylation domain-containing protein [Luteolibacter sp.]
MKTDNNKRILRLPGFTLVEVLVVVAIILVLAVLAFSGSRKLITSARIVESTENLRSLAIANTTFLADNGRYCPADDRSNNRRWHGSRSSESGGFDATQGFLSPYLGKSKRVTICPLFRAMAEGSSSFEDGTGGYGYNAAYIGGLPGGAYDPATKLRISQMAANVTNPGRTVMFTTTAYARSSGLQEYAYCEPPFWDFGSGPTGSKPSPSVHFRANGKALVAWCDGSVTAEARNSSRGGLNPHGGDSEKWNLGWFGPEENNGWWNPRN